MTQTPPGWYPEPDPGYAGPPGRVRYWDGTRWTEHVQDAAAPAPAPMFDYGPGPATTPDGQRLAGWWQRALAYLLDGFIAFPLLVLVASPVIASQWDSLHQWFSNVQTAASNGTPQPVNPPLLQFGSGPWFALSLSTLAANFLYQGVFLLWKQATPGKMIVGLRVRLRDSPGLPAGAVFARLGSTLLISLCFIVGFLDYLWPLWDDKNQALHDKLARTNVVRTR